MGECRSAIHHQHAISDFVLTRHRIAESTLCTKLVENLLATINGLQDELAKTEQYHCFDGAASHSLTSTFLFQTR
jgi:hypothetical protein